MYIKLIIRHPNWVARAPWHWVCGCFALR